NRCPYHHLTSGAHLVASAKKPPKNANPPIGSPEWYDAVEDRSEARSEMVFELYGQGRLGPEPPKRPVGSLEWYEAIEERSDRAAEILYAARRRRKRLH